MRNGSTSNDENFSFKGYFHREKELIFFIVYENITLLPRQYLSTPGSTSPSGLLQVQVCTGFSIIDPLPKNKKYVAKSVDVVIDKIGEDAKTVEFHTISNIFYERRTNEESFIFKLINGEYQRTNSKGDLN